MVDAVLSFLLDKLLTRLVHEGHQLLKFDNHFKEMEEELVLVQMFLIDAGSVRWNERNESLKIVINNLRELVYDAEDIIADCQLYFRKKCRGNLNTMNYLSPSFLIFGSQISTRLREILERFKVNGGRLAFLDTTLNLPRWEMESGNLPPTYPNLTDISEIVGLKDDSEKIEKWVMKASGPLSVIGIVGMGGIGKTTLAQKIISSKQLTDWFDHIHMVVVSQCRNLEELLKKMLNNLNVDEELMRGRDVLYLLEQLKIKLDNKYLVVLDNVWEINKDEWWERLKQGFPQIDGSCVIVTTRNARMAESMGVAKQRIHRPQFLSEEDSWKLFSKVVFPRSNGVCENQDLIRIGKMIVRNCDGLPLAIKTVAGMMQSKVLSVPEWRRISEHLQEELVNSDRDKLVATSLQLSYDDLPSYLKPCLLIFSLHYRYITFSVSYTINMWISEGFICAKNGKTPFEIGEEYMLELWSRCLIIATNFDTFGNRFSTCRIHSKVQEMIMNIAKKENFMGFDDGGRQTITSKSRRGVMLEGASMDILKTNPKLLTLLGLRSREAVLSVEQKTCQIKWLRVLHLQLPNSDIPEKNWLGGIGSLQHLIFLCIGINQLEELPDSIGNLSELQVLFLSNCSKLKRLPQQISTLEKLIDLSIAGCRSLEYIPKDIGKLSNLQRLSVFTPARSTYKDKGCRVADLKTLTQLRSLEMSISEDQIEDGDLDALSNLQQLKSLKVWFTVTNGSNDVVRMVDRPLSPLLNLQELMLFFFPGERTPTWLNPTSLPNLRFVDIRGANLTQVREEFWGSKDMIWRLDGVYLGVGKISAELVPKMKMVMGHPRLFHVCEWSPHQA